jgi:acetate---CoA ligase (ADP-forming)
VDAAGMVGSWRAGSMLRGMRGQPAADAAALADVLLRLSQLAGAHEQIVELDINPLLARPEGAIAVDARVMLA